MAKAIQTYMPTKNADLPMLNQYGQLEYLQFTPKIIAKTASYTVTAKESGSIFTTVGATAAVTFTLPAITDGPFRFTFICGADYSMVVAAATADTMLTMNDLAADNITFNTTAERIGGCVEVYCDGTTLIGVARLGTEAQTPTINT
jgi:hypothetical protein